jgi:hypothetical protein
VGRIARVRELAGPTFYLGETSLALGRRHGQRPEVELVVGFPREISLLRPDRETKPERLPLEHGDPRVHDEVVARPFRELNLGATSPVELEPGLGDGLLQFLDARCRHARLGERSKSAPGR